MKFEPRPADHSVNVTARHPLADAAVLVLGLGAVLLLITLVLAFFADALVARISIKTEMQWFGGMSPPAVLEEVDETDTAETRALSELLARLTQHWQSDYRFRLRVSEDAAPNALAFPGGLIVVTRGLLDNVESENELAFVLAHELGHYRNRDHLRGLGRGAAISLVVGAMTSGGSGGFGFGIADIALRGFGREQETDADVFALGLVYAEYGHVGESWRFFERIQSAYGSGNAMLNYLETHPLPSSRIDDLKRRARERGWPTEGTLVPWNPGTDTPQD
ncbi:MAG: M48 family metallopeptidase [Pseudomonadota bacterium]